MDLVRMALIFTVILTYMIPLTELPKWINPVMLLLMWIKIFNYLAVFESTRYLIKMIFEIIEDVSAFLIILVTAILAYTQIIMSIEETEGLDQTMRNSYVLALGELGEFGAASGLQFIIFVVFSFFIPLILMNMLIAIMSDAYERVQANAVAADSK